MEELNPKNAFGELLLDLIDAQYGGDFDSGIAAIMETTGLTEEEVTAIVNGDTVVEDENLLASIVDAFPDADDDDLEVIVNVATSVDEEDRADIIASLEGGEEYADGDEGAMPEEEMAGAAYGYYNPNVANFGYGMDNARLNQIEQTLANFERQQAVKAITEKLRTVDFMASQAVNAEILPRSYKTMLIGNFSDDGERLARFSQIAADNGVDIMTQLYATEFALGLLTDAADFVEFRDYSISDEDKTVAQFSASLDQVVANDVQAIFSDSLFNF